MRTAPAINHGDEATTAAMRAATPIMVAIPDTIRRNVVSRCDLPTPSTTGLYGNYGSTSGHEELRAESDAQ